MKKLIAIILLTASPTLAFTTLSKDAFKSPLRKLFERVWECTYHVSCYQNKLGSFTQLASTDSQVDFPTTYNANLTKTVEVGTTSVASITTLPGLTTAAALATVGTITSGTWNGSTLTVAYGGTGSTTLSANQILLGNGTGQLAVVNGYGTSGYYLQSQGQGAAPAWVASSIDTSIAYSWTGAHTFSIATTTVNATSSLQKIRVGGAATSDYSETGVVVGTSTHFQKGVSIGGTATTTNNANLQVSGNTILGVATATTLTVNSCIGCSAYTGSSTAFTVTSGNFNSASIPSSANFGIISYTITDAGATILKGSAYFALNGASAVVVGATNGTDDGDYNFEWQVGNNLLIQEITDVNTDSQVTGTVYWYR